MKRKQIILIVESCVGCIHGWAEEWLGPSNGYEDIFYDVWCDGVHWQSEDGKIPSWRPLPDERK